MTNESIKLWGEGEKMHTQDYYQILGVSRKASGDDIKKAYRKSARKFHPDINKEEGAEERFKAIGEAYEVLKDSEKRKLYDLHGADWQNAGADGQYDWGGFKQNKRESSRHGANGKTSFEFNNAGYGNTADIDEILQGLFGGSGDFSFSGGNYEKQNSFYQQPSRSTRQEVELPVTLADLYNGATKHFNLEMHEAESSGGLRLVTRELKVKIPPGVTDGSVIRLGKNNGKSEMESDRELYIRLKVIADSRFSIDGFNLRTEVALTPWEAALGAKIPIETIGSKLTITVPKGTQNRKKLRIKGRGLRKRNNIRGDVIVTLAIRIPEELTAAEEQLLIKLAEASTFNAGEQFCQRGLENV